MKSANNLTRTLLSNGYDAEPTEQNVTSCFLDYCAAGYWQDLDYDEALEAVKNGSITVEHMTNALSK